MFTKNLSLKAITAIILIVVLPTLVTTTALPESQARLLFDSPLPTPSPSPTPWPTISPDLPNAERALQFVAQRQGIPQAWLTLADVFTTELPLAA